MLGLTIAFTLSIGAMSAAIVHLIPYLTDHGWTDLHAAIAAGLIGATQVAARVVFGIFAERVAASPARPRSCCSCPSAASSCSASSDGSAAAWVAVAMLGIGQGTSTLLRPLLLSRRLNPLVYGRGAAQSAAWSTVARAVAPLLLADAAGLGAERLPDRVHLCRRRRRSPAPSSPSAACCSPPTPPSSSLLRRTDSFTNRSLIRCCLNR